MAGPQTPGPGLGTWLFGCWVCRRLWPFRRHLQGDTRKGPRWTVRTALVLWGFGDEALTPCFLGPSGRENSSSGP